MVAQRRILSQRYVATLAVIALLACGLVWGPVTAFGASASPSPNAGNVVLKIGWTSEPDNLNPFIGYEDDTYEIWALNYDFLFGYGDRNQPTLDLASKFPTKANGGISADGLTWTIKIRSGVKWQDGVPLTADDVAFTYNYIVKNHMANFTNSTLGIRSATALNPTTVRIFCSRPKADLESMWVPIMPQHIWEHVPPQTASYELRRQAAARGQWALRDGGLCQGQLPGDGAQPQLLGSQAGHRQDLLRALYERRPPW